MVDSRLIEFRGDNIHIASHRIGGAFFVNAGALFYLYVVGVSVPLLGTRFIETPEISGVRSIIQGDALCDFVLSRLHSDVEKGIDWTIGMISAFYENSGSTTSLSANCPDVAIRTAREIAGNGK
jgi:hypothetical protein